MGTYNRASSNNNLLEKAINSILNQTEKDFEFIIINDGSEDNTAQILNEYAKKDNRIKILTNNKNRGLHISLNKGISFAKGKYIARMDDDDFSLPDRFQKQIEFLKKNPNIDATGCSFKTEKKHLVYKFPYDPDLAKIIALWEVPVLHPCAMIKHDFIKKNGLKYISSFPNAEDLPFWFDFALKHNGKISNLQEILLIKNGSSKKKNNYIYIQKKSLNRYRKYAFSQFGVKVSTRNKCQNYVNLAKQPQTNKYFDVQKLNDYLLKNCPPPNHIYAIHKYWTDYLVFEDNRIKMFRKKDTATILEKTEDMIKIKWDKWGIETFKKSLDDGFFYLDESSES